MVIYKTEMSIAHIQCLLRIDGSILPGVFLTSSFCVVPESSGFQLNAASSFVHVELGTWNCSSAANTMSQQCTASFKDLHTMLEAAPDTGGCSAP